MKSTIELVNIFGAAALLLFGLGLIKDGIMLAFGAKLRQWIAKGTRNRVLAVLWGFLATLLLQSSTAVAVITASFAAREFITLTMGQAVMLGANLGTAIVALILSKDVSVFASLFILAGIAGGMMTKGMVAKGVCRALLGLGLMLLALQLMDAATLPLRDSPVIATVLRALDDAPLIAVLVAALLAVISSSSLAVIVLAMVLAGSNIISPVMSIYMMAGANLGGAVPPYLAVAGEGTEARRLTLANLIVRCIGALVVMVLAEPIARFMLDVTNNDARSLPANAHIAFNIALLIFFLPLLGPVGRLATRLLPESPESRANRPSYLDESLLASPELALAVAKREALRLGDIVTEMLDKAMEGLTRPDTELTERLISLEQQVDKLNEAIKLYVSRLSASKLDEADQKQADEILSYTINLEHIGDIIRGGVAEILSKKARRQLWLSDEGIKELKAFFRQTHDNLRLSQAIFLTRDPTLAQQLAEEKVRIRRMEEQSASDHLLRVRQGRPETIETSSIHLDLLRDLKQINAHLTSIANSVLEDRGMLRESRVMIDKADT